jgi:hypothetical protein
VQNNFPGLKLLSRFASQLQIFLIQTVLILDMLGIFINAVYWADFHALRRVVMAYALGAQHRIDDIDLLALGNGAVGAFGFADIAVDAFIMNNKGHTFS